MGQENQSSRSKRNEFRIFRHRAYGRVSDYRDLNMNDDIAEFDVEPLPKRPIDGYKRARFRLGFFGILKFVILFAMVFVAMYCCCAIFYSFHFFPHSYLNDLDVSNMNGQQSLAAVYDLNENYKLTLHFRDDVDVVLHGSAFRFHVSADPHPANYIRGQSFLDWWKHIFVRHDYATALNVTYDDVAARMLISNEFRSLPDSHDEIPGGYMQTGDGLLIYSPGVPATYYDSSVGLELVVAAIKEGKMELDLRDTDFYKAPYDVSYNPVLARRAEEWNALATLNLNYNSRYLSLYLESADILSHMRLDSNCNIIFSRSYLKQLVREHMDVSAISSDFYQGHNVNGSFYVSSCDAWCGQVADKILHDMQILYTDGTVPDLFSGGSMYTGNTFLLDKSTHTLTLYQNNVSVASYYVSLGAYTSWNSVVPGVYSVASPQTDVFIFTSGMLMGSDESSFNFVVSNIRDLWEHLNGDSVSYVVITESSSEEDVSDAWMNQQLRADFMTDNGVSEVVLDLSNTDLNAR